MGRLKELKPRLSTVGSKLKTLEFNPNATPRQRGRAWMTRRARLLKANPLCCKCEEQGRIRPATEVDHVIPLFKGGPDTDPNTQNLCGDCHLEKTKADVSMVARW